MQRIQTTIPDVFLLDPTVYGDDRGFFMETYNKQQLEKFGIHQTFVQDNHSRSAKNVLRGLHYQIKHPQGKLVRVTEGVVFDVVVDLRKHSASFGQWVGFELSAANKRIAWIPEGFAHGFLVLSDYAEFLYKTTDYWHPEYERSIRWDDPDLNINWPLRDSPILSPKDTAGAWLKETETYT